MAVTLLITSQARLGLISITVESGQILLMQVLQKPMSNNDSKIIDFFVDIPIYQAKNNYVGDKSILRRTDKIP